VLETLEAGVQVEANQNENNLDMSELDPATRAELTVMDTNEDGRISQTELAMAETGGDTAVDVFQRNQQRMNLNPILLRIHNDPRFISRQIKRKPILAQNPRKTSNQITTLQQANAGFHADVNLYNVTY
jgi:hypothetical protein